LNGNIVKIWDCIQHIINEMNISREYIKTCCSRKRKSAGGFVWRFINDEF
jgi:predicted house-cleaning noncanonical NTP pyrophosphatase (MazG superfamily)